MIKKTLVILFFLLILGTLIQHLRNKSKTIVQNQYHGNLCKAEGYILDANSYNTVIVGSSMANRLNKEMLPDSFFLLTFAGFSAFDGLEIAKRSGKKLERIVIEVNVSLLRDKNSQFLADVYKPVYFQLKPQIEILQSRNQPVSQIFPGFAYLFYGTYNHLIKHESSDQIPSITSVQVQPNRIINNPIGNTSLIKIYQNPVYQEILDKYQNNLNAEVLQNLMKKLSQYIQYFDNTGTTTIFLEMPVDSSLSHLPYPSQLRKAITDRFPTYQYISTPKNTNYLTQDGIHLAGEGREQFTQYFLTEIQK